MKRRNFVKGLGTAALAAGMGAAWLERALAAQPRGPAGSPLGASETLLIHNIRIIDVISGCEKYENAIIVKGGRIERLFYLVEDEELPKTDRAMDAGGRYMIPGLINCHVHATMPGAGALSLSLVSSLGDQIDRNCVDCVTHGVTTVRDQLGGQDQLVDRIDRISRGELMGPRILRGIAVQAPGGYGKFFPDFIAKNALLEADTVAEVKDNVARAVDLGADHIKLFLQYISLFQDKKTYPTLSDKMLAAAVDKAASLGKKCAVHQTTLDAFRRSIKAGIQSLEHMPIDGPLTDGDIEALKDGKHHVIPTGTVAYSLVYPVEGDENFQHENTQRLYKDREERIDALIGEYCEPKIARLARKVHEKYSRPGYFDKNHLMITPDASYFNRSASVGVENTKRLYDAGCMIGCGNDGGIPFVWPGMISVEMAINEEMGMTPADVLRAATIVNAQNIGMEDELGTIDEGKIADLVLLDADPLETVRNVEKIEAVLQAGRLSHSNGKIKI